MLFMTISVGGWYRSTVNCPSSPSSSSHSPLAGVADCPPFFVGAASVSGTSSILIVPVNFSKNDLLSFIPLEFFIVCFTIKRYMGYLIILLYYLLKVKLKRDSYFIF